MDLVWSCLKTPRVARSRQESDPSVLCRVQWLRDVLNFSQEVFQKVIAAFDWAVTASPRDFHCESATITIQCDNQQTIRIVESEAFKLQTRLRHVDVHNHWLRQEAQRGTLKVIHAPLGRIDG